MGAPYRTKIKTFKGNMQEIDREIQDWIGFDPGAVYIDIDRIEIVEETSPQYRSEFLLMIFYTNDKGDA